MKTAIFGAASLIALAAALGAHAASVPPPCGDDDNIDDLTMMYGDDVASHRTFDLKPIVFAEGDNASYQIELKLFVKADGTIKCVALPEDDTEDPAPFAQHYPDDAIRAAVASWRYEPYHDGGAAIPFEVVETVLITHAPQKPVPMPPAASGDTVTLERTDCFGSCPAYKVTIHGDGHVDYSGTEYTGVTGDLSYTVTPADAKALFDQLRGDGVWSAQDAYAGAMSNGATNLLTLNIGGQTKTIRDYLGTYAGMPDSVIGAETAVDTVAGTDRWIHVTLDSLADLDALHFDYAGPGGAALLVNAIEDTESDDAVVQAIIDRHPSLAGSAPWDTPETVKLPLDAALQSGRTAAVLPLIKAGALLKDGKPDPVRIDSAFRVAIQNGDVDSAKTLGALHPSLTWPYSYTDYDTEPSTDKTADISDLFLIDPDSDNAFTMYQYLLSLGADPKARDHSGTSVLQKLGGNFEIAKSLIGLGVDINAKDNDGDCALLDVGNEDSALLLLNSGADPTATNSYGDTIWSQTDFYDWTQVEAWLKAHKIKQPAQN